ncbi:hypothetical protein L917_13782, partial [Phytophthora nicotianae]
PPPMLRPMEQYPVDARVRTIVVAQTKEAVLFHLQVNPARVRSTTTVVTRALLLIPKLAKGMSSRYQQPAPPVSFRKKTT